MMTKATFFLFVKVKNLSKGATLDLVAVLSVGELLVVSLVLAGHESLGHSESRALGQTNIGSKTTDFTGNSFHAFLALNNCGVDVIDTFDNIGHGVNIIFSMTFPSYTRQGNKGGEEERETSQNKDAHNDGCEVRQSFLFLVGNTIRVRRCSISSGWCSIGSCRGSIGISRLLVRLSWGTIARASFVFMSMSTVPFQKGVFGNLKGTGSGQAQSSNGGFSEHLVQSVDG
jgi:hypothetical protein